MIWSLLAVKGGSIEIPFFKDNLLLSAYLKEHDITLVSSLDALDIDSHDLREPIHQFLYGFYPFYRENDFYQTNQNPLVDGIIQNIKKPEYLNFLFNEIGVHGPDGPYILVFNDDQLSVKYLGAGPWNNYAIREYILSTEVYPPTEWPKETLSDASNYLTTLDSVEPKNSLSDLEPFAVESRESRYSSDDFEESHFSDNFESEFHRLYGEIPPDALKLIRLIREQRLELGFQQLLQLLQVPILEKNKPIKAIEAPVIPKLTVQDPLSFHFAGLGELNLEPLHRSLYALFLQYPQGINLYQLDTYKDSIKHFYLQISQRESAVEMDKSINRLVNRFDNSIYEKISRINRQIKELFLKKDYDASAFLINGKRGEAKKVLASRDLVTWEI